MYVLLFYKEVAKISENWQITDAELQILDTSVKSDQIVENVGSWEMICFYNLRSDCNIQHTLGCKGHLS